MTANKLQEKYHLTDHAENGRFAEKHYPFNKAGRAESGCIYYHIFPGESSKFHRIDCDEYWCFHAGSNLEIWTFSLDGILKKHLLGASEEAEPTILFKKGEIFAARLSKENKDGTFLTCITVPRFTYQGFEIIEKETMLALFPESAAFWK